MNTTPVSLLERLRRPRSQEVNQEAWGRFVRLYAPLLYHWVQRSGFDRTDADDLVQDVFASLVQKMPEFAYDKDKSFRAWLRTVALNKWRESKRRKSVPMEPLGDHHVNASTPDPAEQFWEEEYRREVIRRALMLMQADFPEPTWRACWQIIVEGKPTAQAAAELNTTASALYQAKFRILTRLREELAGLVD